MPDIETHSEPDLEADSSAPFGRTRPRVLTVLPDFPFPATTGLHLRMVSNLQLVHRLGCFSALLYFSTEGRERLPVESTPLARICHEVRHGGRRFLHANFSTASLIRHKVDFLLRGVLGIPGKRYPFSMSYDRIGAAGIILAEARRVQADFVVLPSMLMHYTTDLRAHGFGIIVDAADVLTNLTASFLNLKGRGGRIGLYANYLASRTQERLFVKQCSELWTTSADEAEEFRRIAPTARVIVVPNSLNENTITPAPPASVEPIIGFIGTYSYAPNLQAALFLAEQVFPHVLDQCPNAVLRIAGANMPADSIAKLHKMKNVEALGPVPDSGLFMDDCAVLVLPVFIRGGVPLKVIEAMARGKAIVASPELTAGLAVVDGKDMLVRADPGDFAAAIVTLLTDAQMREQLGANARAAFVRDFSLSNAEKTLRRESLLTISKSRK